MLLLLLAIAIALGLLASALTKDTEDVFMITVFFGFIPLLVLVIMLLSYPYKIDDKLKMYEEENKKIEEKVKDTVRVYMEYEKNTYNNLIKDADLTTLLVKYPELNSNELVKSEVNLYIENNKAIKELKVKKISRSTYNWWIYFGK